ncbi:hypothetical protein [Streptomyces sp. ISL-86]|uniref:hypothetical protein n=1 Tax=Streptomyces sp. ISL-86 TaxID=2819187 RepID=UPI001BEC43E7|nr:hypothetical protein [Streptomyces sp. ISL-86]MBT2457174.1 hypothetical protein [Streptomyces sp. ISL-86]
MLTAGDIAWELVGLHGRGVQFPVPAHVRRAAAANPLVPGEALPALLEDPATAEGAAANPSLPAERLHTLLDLSGVPRAGGGSRQRT